MRWKKREGEQGWEGNATGENPARRKPKERGEEGGGGRFSRFMTARYRLLLRSVGLSRDDRESTRFDRNRLRACKKFTRVCSHKWLNDRCTEISLDGWAVRHFRKLVCLFCRTLRRPTVIPNARNSNWKWNGCSLFILFSIFSAFFSFLFLLNVFSSSSQSSENLRECLRSRRTKIKSSSKRSFVSEGFLPRRLAGIAR